MKFYQKLLFLVGLFCFSLSTVFSQNYSSEGPFNQLIIRGVTLINGDGSPPRGPIDI
ncbi:amidohydrolase, partial [Winogradskyella sp.]|nr:amidohydrolase [Winogradskyella sp.]